jgi:hypothetical protein
MRRQLRHFSAFLSGALFLVFGVSLFSEIGLTATIGNTRSEQEQKQKQMAELTKTYAEHIYTTICADEYRAGLPIHKLKKYEDQQAAYTHAQTVCKCMAGEMLKKLEPQDVVDYVMYNYGTEDDGPMDADTKKYYMSEKASQADEIVGDPKLRQKCGFLK